eukprot:COSAG05_NODE_4376_length_1543_cov_3.538781_1_plen_318_part_00
MAVLAVVDVADGENSSSARVVACHGHGDPTTTGACVCDAGHDGCMYSRELCNGHGEPDAGGGCTCDDGYMGIRCIYSRNATCNGHGEPSSTGDCTCDDGYDTGYYYISGNDGFQYYTLGTPVGTVGRICQRSSRETTCNGHGEPYGSGGCDCDYDQIPGVPWVDNNETTIARSPTCADHRPFYGYFCTSWWKLQLVGAMFISCALLNRAEKQPGCDINDEQWFPCCCLGTAVCYFVWPFILASLLVCMLVYGLVCGLVCGCDHCFGAWEGVKRKRQSRLDIPMRPVSSVTNPAMSRSTPRESEDIWTDLALSQSNNL